MYVQNENRGYAHPLSISLSFSLTLPKVPLFFALFLVIPLLLNSKIKKGMEFLAKMGVRNLFYKNIY